MNTESIERIENWKREEICEIDCIVHILDSLNPCVHTAHAQCTGHTAQAERNVNELGEWRRRTKKYILVPVTNEKK